MKSVPKLLPLLGLLWLVIQLAGCAGEPTLGDQMVKEGEDLSELGDRWNKGKNLIEDGEALIKEGEANIKKGRQMIEEGRQLMKESESLFQQRIQNKQLQ
ncbi:MAG: hypothetical protein SVR94_10985 [Pseudomonadota bacterium]|nr:hypothetical protein [Pseudomonadota bacterium]